MSQLKDRVAIVTGASAGIGRAITNRLLEAGASVVINARRGELLQEIEREWNSTARRVASVAGDAADETVIAELFNAAQRHFGKPADLIVVNAGKGLGGPLREVDLEDFAKILELNVLGASRLMKRAALSLSERPWKGAPEDRRDIVVLGSIAGRHVSPFSGVYGATKFAVGGLAEALRREVGPAGVRVTLIEPAIVISDFQDSAGYSKEFVADVTEKFGPLLEPDDIARFVVYATSEPANVHVSTVVIRPTRQSYP